MVQNKKGFFKKIVSLSVLVIALSAGIVLVSQNQDIREKAAYDESCFRKCIVSGSPSNQCYSDCAVVSNEVNCLPPRYMQNGNCIGNPSENLKLKKYAAENKCVTNADCQKGMVCILNVCVKKQ